MQIRRKKRLTVSIVLTIVLMICSYPIYMIGSTENFFRAWHNKEARLNIFFSGNKDNRLELLHASRLVKSEQPDWYNNPSWIKAPGQGTMVQAKIYRQYRKIELEYKAIGDGTVTIYLLGPHNKWDNGKLYPVWVYYKDFEVNGQKIFQEGKKVNYDNGYEYKLELKNGEEFRLSFEAKRSLPLNIVSNIEPLLFFSFFVISFLLSRLIVYWLGKFKIFEHNSRIDIVFLSVFFVLLLLPVSKIEHSEKSVQENRMLAKYIPMIDGGGRLNQKYGKNFEAWFNDRFNLRNWIIKNYNTFQYRLNNYFSGRWYNVEIYFSKDGWMFDSSETRRFHSLNPHQIQKAIQNLTNLKNFFEQEGIKFYFFVSPTKGDIYAEYNIRYLQEKDKTTELISEIQKETGIKIYYPREKYFFAKEKDIIFYKTDHHSTETASWIAYNDISRKIIEDFPSFYLMTINDYIVKYDNKVHYSGWVSQGASAERINVDVSDLLVTQYKYYEAIHKKDIQIKKITNEITDYTNLKSDNNLKMMLIGNSFTENLANFFPYSVKNVRKFRTNSIGLNMRKIEPEIKKYKPDMVVFAIHSSWMTVLFNIY